MVIDDEKEILYKGDTDIIPVGIKHAMTNIGQEDAEYLAIGTAKGKLKKNNHPQIKTTSRLYTIPYYL